MSDYYTPEMQAFVDSALDSDGITCPECRESWEWDGVGGGKALCSECCYCFKWHHPPDKHQSTADGGGMQFP